MRIFITGGAGFIGSNCARHFLNNGHRVVIYDNLSRIGGKANLKWLRENHDHGLSFVFGDVRDYESLSDSIKEADVVLHLASQVAVTTSVVDPRQDFEINALGTFNVLEAVRNHCRDAIVLYASTNKVYGGMDQVRIVEEDTRYSYQDFTHGIPENFPLEFHSPYGCSKGAGDQYVIDYARIYGLKTLTLRQSCIYGKRQFGVEDQGWVAHMIIAACFGHPITIFGDGKQIRALLHIRDLVSAYELCISNIDNISGQAINLGGGPQNVLSVWAEFGPMLEEFTGRPIEVSYEDWRPGDQKVFVADINRAKDLLGWEPSVSVTDGIRELYDWINENPHLFQASAMKK